MSGWNEEHWKSMAARVAALEGEMVTLQKELCARPAMSPVNGGQGEFQKAAFLKAQVSLLAPDELVQVDAPDPDAEGGVRPTIIARWKGTDPSRTLWIMTHHDVVPPGELSQWKGDPWKAWVEDGRIYGRGVEDNQQSLVASFFAVKAWREQGTPFPINIGLMFMADEENGSHFGMEYVMEHSDWFRKGDLMVVPDSGSKDGGDIEIAEKGRLGVKVKTLGLQCHASRPAAGVNAFRAGSALAVRFADLYREFPQRNELFQPAISTFEPTKKDPNVPNINTIPGEDVFYVDCRILPEIDPNEVFAAMRRMADGVEKEYGVTVELSAGRITRSAPATDAAAPVVQLTERAIRAVHGVEPRHIGIGGGTVGEFLRRAGHPTVIIGRIDSTAHQANEYCVIRYMVADAQLFAYMIGEASTVGS